MTADEAPDPDNGNRSDLDQYRGEEKKKKANISGDSKKSRREREDPDSDGRDSDNGNDEESDEPNGRKKSPSGKKRRVARGRKEPEEGILTRTGTHCLFLGPKTDMIRTVTMNPSWRMMKMRMIVDERESPDES